MGVARWKLPRTTLWSLTFTILDQVLSVYLCLRHSNTISVHIEAERVSAVQVRERLNTGHGRADTYVPTYRHHDT